jgi:hypothetical protein
MWHFRQIGIAVKGLQICGATHFVLPFVISVFQIDTNNHIRDREVCIFVN